MPTNFAQVGRDLSGAIDFYRQQKEKKDKENSIREFVNRQLARLPPEKQAEAQAIISGQDMAPAASVGTAMPASTLMDGTPDMAIPPEVSGASAPIDDLFNPPPEETPDEMVKSDPGVESLRMMLEAVRDKAMEPKGLFDYIANMGKQDVIGSNRMAVEQAKAELRRELQQTDLEARLNRLEASLTTQRDIAEGRNQASAQNVERTNQSRERVAGQTNKTRKEIAQERPPGVGGKNPAAMSQEEIDAELEVLAAEADSLENAGMDPGAIGRRDPEKQQYRIDETARQKDLSRVMDRVRSLKAERQRGAATAGKDGGKPPKGAYGSPREVMKARKEGKLAKGDSVQVIHNGVLKTMHVDL